MRDPLARAPISRTTAHSGDLMGNGWRSFVITAEDPAYPVGELASTEQPLGLDYPAFVVNALGLDRVEARAPGGQRTRHYPDPTAAILDLGVGGGDPLSPLGSCASWRGPRSGAEPSCLSPGAFGKATRETVWLRRSPGDHPRISATPAHAPADKALSKRALGLGSFCLASSGGGASAGLSGPGNAQRFSRSG
jgi:hypothetical protein